MKIAHAIVVLALLVPACSTAGLTDGTETSPCVDGQCLGNLVCSAGVCVAPIGDDDDDDDDDDDEPTGSVPPLPTTAGESTSTMGDTTEPASSTTDDTTDGRVSTTDSSEAGSWGEASTTSGDPSGVGFIEDPDVGPGAIECSVWDQDCPAGEKCNAWADDGGNSWNATRCVDVVNSPDDLGEGCEVEGSGVSGSDTCDVGLICFGVDGETNIGECVAYCSGSELAPDCPEGTQCVVANGGVLPLCRTACDPLLQPCGAGEGCYPVGDAFVCSPDASGEAGVYGDPCEYINVCEPGLACVDGNAIPGCGAAGCCSPFCDLDAPDCPAGLDCVAAFEDGQAPPGDEDVGYCLSP